MKKLLTKKIFSVLTILTLIVSLVGCGNSSSKKEAAPTTTTVSADKLQGALKDYTFKIGTSGTYAPFSYYDKDGKTLIGFDMDFLKELQKILGFKIEGDKLQAMDYSPLTTSVAEGKLDFVVAALCATDKRKKVMNFTDTYYNAGLTVITNKNTSPKEITGFDSIKSGKYKVAVEKGTASNLYLVSANVPQNNLQIHDSITTALQALEDGKVDAVVHDAPGTAYYISTKKDTKLQMVGKWFAQDQSQYAVAVSFKAAKSNPQLMSILNAAVKKLHDDGTITKLEDKWCKAAK